MTASSAADVETEMKTDDEQVSDRERVAQLVLALEQQQAAVRFVDDRLVAAELVITALVSRLRSEDGAVEDIRRLVHAATEHEGEDGRLVREHASLLLPDL